MLSTKAPLSAERAGPITELTVIGASYMDSSSLQSSFTWHHAALGKYQLLVNVCFWPKFANGEGQQMTGRLLPVARTAIRLHLPTKNQVLIAMFAR